MGTSKYYVPLKGFTTVHQHTTSNDIQDNLVEFFDWSLLEKNNYFNSTLGELSPDSQDYSKLRLSKNENFTAGQVWEGHRENWVWQSGISGVDGYHNPLVLTILSREYLECMWMTLFIHLLQQAIMLTT